MEQVGDESGPWYLQGYLQNQGHIERCRLRPFPFLIGRSAECGLQVLQPGVSYLHAEIAQRNGLLYIRDLGSTNGTFVNGRKLQNAAVQIKDGDVIHIVSQEMRLVRADAFTVDDRPSTLRLDAASLPLDWINRSARLTKILEGNLEAWYQPIVDWDSRPIAWEALSRGRTTDMVVLPSEMFQTATENDRRRDLCRAMRTAGLDGGPALPAPGLLFLNAAPEDLEERDQMLTELREYTDRGGTVVVEINESAVVDPVFMKRFHEELKDVGCGLAFDDFGAGHSRLLELTEMKPDYLKFDMAFIRGIDQAPAIRKDLVRLFVSLVSDYGIATIAEGVERAEEASFCREAGFNLAQGFFFGKPVPVNEL